jgi:hypothetical protein
MRVEDPRFLRFQETAQDKLEAVMFRIAWVILLFVG